MCSTNAQGCASWKENTLHCSLIIVMDISWMVLYRFIVPYRVSARFCHLPVISWCITWFSSFNQCFPSDSLWFQCSRFMHKLTQGWKYYAVDTGIAVVVCWEIFDSSGQDCIKSYFGKLCMAVILLEAFKFYKTKLGFVQCQICIIIV